ncbi:MAG TPA: pyridoxamine 5'-phosphate oxidase family protein [Luteolibacter sp.]
MASISQNQPEHRADLSGKAAIDKIKEFVEETRSCFFCTEVATIGMTHGRPMEVRRVDEAGTLWFLSSDESHKNEELLHDPRVRLYFQGASGSDFLELSGMAHVTKDAEKVRELWDPALEAWFAGGMTDPRITVIRVTPTEGYYWDTQVDADVEGVKMRMGAALREMLAESVEGRLRV